MSPAPSRRALRAQRMLGRLRRAGATAMPPRTTPVDAMGLHFASPLGLAAGFDRTGRLRRCAHRLGLGAIEAGTLHAAHPGLHRLARGRARVPIGVSLGKRPGTPWTEAAGELARAMGACHRQADYLALNPGRERPTPTEFARVVAELAAHRDALARRCGRRLPLVVKLPPAWASDVECVAAAHTFVAAGADGLLVSAEGMSSAAACAVLRALDTALGREVCLISVGGIDGAREARARVRAGARLVQVHGGVAVGGEAFIAMVARALT